MTTRERASSTGRVFVSHNATTTLAASAVTPTAHDRGAAPRERRPREQRRAHLVAARRIGDAARQRARLLDRGAEPDPRRTARLAAGQVSRQLGARRRAE